MILPTKNSAQTLLPALSAGWALAQLQASTQGLSSEDVRRQLAQYGLKVLERTCGAGPPQLLWRPIHDALTDVLPGSAALGIVTGKVLDGGVVRGVLVLKMLIGFIQELRAGHAIEALSTTCPRRPPSCAAVAAEACPPRTSCPATTCRVTCACSR